MASLQVFPQTDGTIYAGSCTNSASFSVLGTLFSDTDLDGLSDFEGATPIAGKRLGKAWGRYIGNHIFNQELRVLGPDGHDWTFAMAGVTRNVPLSATTA